MFDGEIIVKRLSTRCRRGWHVGYFQSNLVSMSHLEEGKDRGAA